MSFIGQNALKSPLRFSSTVVLQAEMPEFKAEKLESVPTKVLQAKHAVLQTDCLNIHSEATINYISR